MTGARCDLGRATRAHVRLSSLVWLHDVDDLWVQCCVAHGPQPKNPHRTKPTVIRPNPTTSAMSRNEGVCCRNGLKPIAGMVGATRRWVGSAAMTDEALSFITTADRGPVRRLTLDRPHRKNAVPPEGWAQLAEAFDEFEASNQRVLIVTGAGGDFCAGADLGDEMGGETGRGIAETTRMMRAPAHAALRLHRLSKPTVAAVDGVAVGAGMQLALGCDIVVATTRARFSEIFVKRGMALDFGGTWLLPRLVGLAKARELALTGRIVEAREALAIGMVALVVDEPELDATVSEIADDLAAGAPLAQRFIKTGLDRSWAMTFEQALAHEDQAQAILLTTDDFAEGVASFRQRRPPQFRGR